MNSLHKDYFIQAGFGFGKPLRTFLRIVFVFGFVFILMFGNGYLQAQRLIGQWESPSGNTVWEFGRDGTIQIWDYESGWSDYYEWYVNVFTNRLNTTVSRFEGDVLGFFMNFDNLFLRDPAVIISSRGHAIERTLPTYEIFNDEFTRIR